MPYIFFFQQISTHLKSITKTLMQSTQILFLTFKIHRRRSYHDQQSSFPQNSPGIETIHSTRISNIRLCSAINYGSSCLRN